MPDRLRKIIRILVCGYACFLIILALMPFWPREFWWLATIVQFAPFYVLVFPAVLLLILSGAARLWKIALIQILLIPFILVAIMRFEFNIGAPDGRTEDKTITILSMNIGKDFETGRPLNVDKFLRLLHDVNPDIIALQEAGGPRLLERIRSEFPDEPWRGLFESEFSLISRMPLSREPVDWKEGRKPFSKYQITGESYVINYYNVHFMTPRYGLNHLREKGLAGVQEVKRTTEYHEKESRLASLIVWPDRNVIVSGDFNLTILHPIYREHWARFTNVFSKRGSGFGRTKNFPFHGLKGFRIDHILVDQNWEVVNAFVGPPLGSDHRPVIATLRFIGEPDAVRKKDPPSVGGADLFYYENFAQGPGKFLSHGTGDLTVDGVNTYFSGNALRAETRPGAGALKAGVGFDLWDIETGGVVRFFYRIPQKTEVCLSVKTQFDDWIALAGVAPDVCEGVMPDGFVRLEADDQWHEAVIDVKTMVRSILASLRYLDEFVFTLSDPGGDKAQVFWIQEFMIGARE